MRQTVIHHLIARNDDEDRKEVGIVIRVHKNIRKTRRADDLPPFDPRDLISDGRRRCSVNSRDVADKNIRDAAYAVWSAQIDMNDVVEEVVQEIYGVDQITEATAKEIDIMRGFAVLRLTEEMHRLSRESLMRTIGDWANE